jgi:hypothetical protein
MGTSRYAPLVVCQPRCCVGLRATRVVQTLLHLRDPAATTSRPSFTADFAGDPSAPSARRISAAADDERRSRPASQTAASARAFGSLRRDAEPSCCELLDRRRRAEVCRPPTTPLDIVQLASLGRAERRDRVREDPEVNVGAGDRAAGFHNACASSTLAVVGDQSARIAQRGKPRGARVRRSQLDWEAGVERIGRSAGLHAPAAPRGSAAPRQRSGWVLGQCVPLAVTPDACGIDSAIAPAALESAGGPPRRRPFGSPARG